MGTWSLRELHPGEEHPGSLGRCVIRSNLGLADDVPQGSLEIVFQFWLRAHVLMHIYIYIHICQKIWELCDSFAKAWVRFFGHRIEWADLFSNILNGADLPLVAINFRLCTSGLNSADPEGLGIYVYIYIYIHTCIYSHTYSYIILYICLSPSPYIHICLYYILHRYLHLSISLSVSALTRESGSRFRTPAEAEFRSF